MDSGTNITPSGVVLGRCAFEYGIYSDKVGYFHRKSRLNGF